MKKIIALVAVLAFMFSVFAGARVALAAQPNNQACLGEDVSGYAQNGIIVFELGSDPLKLADVIKFIASDLHIVGEDIQAHLAGDIPDEAVPNSCNDV